VDIEDLMFPRVLGANGKRFQPVLNRHGSDTADCRLTHRGRM
jgi:hypothetical protein